MSEPPSSADHGNVVDPDVFAQRRARRAEVGEDATLEMKLFDAEQRLGDAEAERDALRAALEAHERESAASSEPLEVSVAAVELASVRERLERAEALLSTVTDERDRARSALYQARMSAEAAAARRLALEREHAALREELERRTAIARDTAAAVSSARVALEGARVGGADAVDLAARLERESSAFAEQVHAVERAVGAVRAQLAAAMEAVDERLAAERTRRAGIEAALRMEREALAEAEARAQVAADGRAAAEARAQAAAQGRAAVEGVLSDERAARAEVEAEMASEREAREAVEAELRGEREAHARAEAEMVAEREARLGSEAKLVSERDAARGEQERLERELALYGQLEASLRGELDGLAAELDDLRGELDAARGELESARGDLESARAERDDARAELEELRVALDRARSGDEERVQRMAARIDAVVALASQLRERVARERASEEEALTAALQAMQARMAQLQDAVAETGRLREELEAERAARAAAEAARGAAETAQVAAEAARGEAEAARGRAEAALSDAEAARAEAEARLAEAQADRAELEARLADVEAELAELREAPPGPPAAADPESIASLREALDGLRAVQHDEAAAPSLGLDLAAAAERLRAAAGEPVGEEAEADALADEAATGDGLAAPMPLPALPPLATVLEPEAALGTPTDEPLRQPLPARAPIAAPRPWLRDTLVALAGEEPEIAELLVAALLPAQAGLVPRPLTYDLLPEGGMAQRVVLTPERARLELPGDGPGGADACVAGPLTALVPLATGGAGRRLPGARVEGRWALRRLLKARRAPVGLAELAASNAAPAPGLLLTVLARAVEPRWTAGRPLAVDVAVQGADRWRVEASGEGPLVVLPAAGMPPAAATLHTAPGRLAAVLAGTASADEAWVEGDLDAVRRLLSWLDRAQRAER